MNELSNSVEKYSIEQALQQWWGYSEFRPMQREIIESVLSGRDTLALMPTGGGKSLTFQLPALLHDGLTIVVTPLIALMKDQVDQLRRRGIPAAAVHSGMESRQIEITLDNCTYGDIRLLYIAPERLATNSFRVRLRQMRLRMIVVDEAHCISQWGYDFRPSYLRIAELREYAPDAVILALTASATELVTKDIMSHLKFSEPHIIRSSFARPNLSYVVRESEDKYEQLQRILNNVDGAAIIYMRTREGCEQLATKLKADGHKAEFYHAGLPSMERAIRQDEWLDGKQRIIVATNAFGMGIDKPDVRLVVHYSMCDSLEAYYQEAGRAGRDGKRSYAVLMTAKEDTDRISKIFKSEFPPIEQIKYVYERVCNYLQIAIGDGALASFNFNIHEFCHINHLSTNLVRSALKILEQNDLMTLLEEQDNPAKLIFTCSRDHLYKLNVGGNEMDILLRTILRMYNGIFTSFRAIDEQHISATSGLGAERVHELLKVLWRMNIIRYIPASHTPMIYFNTERLPQHDIFISPESYHIRYKLSHERFSNMLRYASSIDTCRSQIIENYFGDRDAKPCGVCDICLKAKRSTSDRSTLQQHIIALLTEEHRTIKEVVAAIKGEPRYIIECVDKLLREEKISLNDAGKLKINT